MTPPPPPQVVYSKPAVAMIGPIGEAPRICRYARALAIELPATIVSTWHDDCARTGATVDPDDDATRERIHIANKAAILSARVCVAMMDRGTPRASNFEIGYAIGNGIPVVWVHGPNGEGRNLGDADALVARVLRHRIGGGTTARIVAAVRQAMAMPQAPPRPIPGAAMGHDDERPEAWR